MAYAQSSINFLSGHCAGHSHPCCSQAAAHMLSAMDSKGLLLRASYQHAVDLMLRAPVYGGLQGAVLALLLAFP